MVDPVVGVVVDAVSCVISIISSCALVPVIVTLSTAAVSPVATNDRRALFLLSMVIVSVFCVLSPVYCLIVSLLICTAKLLFFVHLSKVSVTSS